MELKRFDQWVARARAEESPRPDVAPAVLRRLRQASPVPAPNDWLWVMASVSAAAAVVCAVVGYRAWTEIAAQGFGWVQEVPMGWML